MAFINKRTYEIAHKINEMYGKIPDDFFEVDELIAPAISHLNKRGYDTISSCSGHAFPELMAFRQSKNQASSLVRSKSLSKSMNLIDGMPYVMSIDTFYILFRKEYNFFPDLDGYDGFELRTIKTMNGDHSLLSKKYSAPDGTIEKIREINKTMEFIALWASEVDDISRFREAVSRAIMINELPLFKKSSLRTL